MSTSTRVLALVAVVGLGSAWYKSSVGRSWSAIIAGLPPDGGLEATDLRALVGADAAIPCDKEQFYIAPFPWEEIQRTALLDGLREGTRLLACAVGKEAYRFGAGPAYAIAREHDGRVSLYRTYGTPAQIAAAYESVSSPYMPPDDNWQLVCQGETAADIFIWLQAEVSGVGAEALELFSGGASAGLRQWVGCP